MPGEPRPARSHGYFEAMRSEDARALIRHYPPALTLAAVIAHRARWRNDGLACPASLSHGTMPLPPCQTTLCVSDWRDYLILHGRGGTLERVETSAKPRHDRYAEIFGDGLLAGHGRGMDGIGEFLELALTAADGQTTPEQRDTIVIWLRLISAARVHHVAVKNGCPASPLTDVEFDPQAAPEDNDWYPPKIHAAANRINFHLGSARAHFYRPTAK